MISVCWVVFCVLCNRNRNESKVATTDGDNIIMLFVAPWDVLWSVHKQDLNFTYVPSWVMMMTMTMTDKQSKHKSTAEGDSVHERRRRKSPCSGITQLLLLLIFVRSYAGCLTAIQSIGKVSCPGGLPRAPLNSRVTSGLQRKVSFDLQEMEICG